MKACVLHIYRLCVDALVCGVRHKPTFLGLLLPLKNVERLDHPRAHSVASQIDSTPPSLVTPPHYRSPTPTLPERHLPLAGKGFIHLSTRARTL
jgi:hypothetical protein